MPHSTVTSKGQTTIPEEKLCESRLAISWNTRETEPPFARPGIRSLKGVLASKRGKGMSCTEIRKIATEAARAREESPE